MLAGEDVATPDRLDNGPALPPQPISNLTHGGLSVMDALLVLSLFLRLALLAARFGHDSREHLASTEEALAAKRKRDSAAARWHDDAVSRSRRPKRHRLL
jgi:hypothetical protein